MALSITLATRSRTALSSHSIESNGATSPTNNTRTPHAVNSHRGRMPEPNSSTSVAVTRLTVPNCPSNACSAAAVRCDESPRGMATPYTGCAFDPSSTDNDGVSSLPSASPACLDSSATPCASSTVTPPSPSRSPRPVVAAVPPVLELAPMIVQSLSSSPRACRACSWSNVAATASAIMSLTGAASHSSVILPDPAEYLKVIASCTRHAPSVLVASLAPAASVTCEDPDEDPIEFAESIPGSTERASGSTWSGSSAKSARSDESRCGNGAA
mmetsp:Transcript_68869/g.153694  ORF Transcript_68869/g.153694 Transcript_68869/m.153694 type:complete len:271 (+) Transcript_68869:470-1282(+)